MCVGPIVDLEVRGDGELCRTCWLAVLGIVLFLATLVIGLIRGARNRT